MVVNAVYAGPTDEGTKLVQPLIDATPLLQNISTVTWNNVLSSAFFGTAPKDATCTKQLYRDVYGLGIKTYDVQTYDTYLSNLQVLYQEYPATQSSVFFIEMFPTQAVRAVSDNATAYPHRDITAHL